MAQAPSPTPDNAGPEPDPSMDDILASIRRILNDDEKTAKASAEGVLMLDPSMIVEEEKASAGKAEEGSGPALVAPPPAPAPAPAPVQAVPERPILATPSETEHSDVVIDEPTPPAPISVAREAPVSAGPTLVAPEAAAAAGASVSALVRTLAAERSAVVSRGLVTIEDLVREEIRPLLKAWLDNHLPPVVERLVQAEIERVVGRNAG